MRRPFFRTLTLLAACSTLLSAQEPDFRIRIDVTGLAPTDERWLELRTQNFLVVGSADEERLRKVAADLELFRTQVALFFPRARLTSSVPTTVVVFRNGETFRPYRRVITEKPEDVDGYFQAGTDKNHLVLSDNAPNRSIYREYVRSLIPDSMGPVPNWFRVGLSEYFTTFRVNWSGDSRWIEVGGRDKEFNGQLRNESLTPLRAFLDAEPRLDQARAADSGTLEYAQSWALTHYLLQGERGRLLKPAMEFFQALADGIPTDVGFPAAFTTSVKDFEGESRDDGKDSGFRGYVREARAGILSPDGERTAGGWYVTLAGFSQDENQKTMRSFFYSAGICKEFTNGVEISRPCTGSLTTIPVNRDPIWADIKKSDVRLLTEAETDFHRGDLMLHIGRLDEAEGLLQLALRIDPKVADAHAALGLLRVRQGQTASALRSLKLATDLEPRHYLGHYYTALAMDNVSRQTATDARQLDSISLELKTAVEIAPHFVEAVQMLAEVNARRRADLDESIDIVRDALKQSPGRESLVLTLARVLAARENSQEAGRVLDRVAASRTAESFMKEAAAQVRTSLSELPQKPVAAQQFFAAAQEEDSTQESVEVRLVGNEIPEGVLVPLNPSKLPEGEKLQGKLLKLDCSVGLTVVVDAGAQTVRLHSNNPAKIEFVSNSQAVSDTISCGDKPGLPVTIIYRPDRPGAISGEPVRIEFTEDPARQ